MTDIPLDPVCGMSVQPSQAVGVSEYQGLTYYFCCASARPSLTRIRPITSLSRPPITPFKAESGGCIQHRRPHEHDRRTARSRP